MPILVMPEEKISIVLLVHLNMAARGRDRSALGLRGQLRDGGSPSMHLQQGALGGTRQGVDIVVCRRLG